MRQTLFKLITLSALVGTLFLAACSNPKNYDVTALSDAQKAELGKQLTAEEGQKLAAWMLRHALSKDGPAAGTTVAQAIKEQDSWIAQQKAEEAQAEALAKKVAAEKQAKQAEFAKILTVSVTGKDNHVGEYEEKFVTLTIAYANKSDKDILGVKGVLRLTDIFGDKIENIRWSFDKGIPAKQTTVHSGSGVKINPFTDDDMKLWNTDFSRLKTVFEVKTIIFKDGTQADAPD